MAAAAVIGALGAAGAVQADPLKIRVGWVQTPGHMAPVIEALSKKHPEIFKHLGQSYAFDPIHFAGTTPQIQAQAIGELDIASQAPSALALAITNAHLDLRIVADVLQDGHPGSFSEYFVVKADGPIKKIEDVKGQKIATNTIGSASDSAMRAMFRKHGIQDADFTTVETSFSNMPAMLDGGKVDMIGVLPQFVKGIVDNDKYKVLFQAKDAVGQTQAVMWAMRADTIAAHRPAFVDFFEDHIRAVRWFLDPANHKEAVEICCGGDQAAGGEARLRLHQGRFLSFARRRARDRLGPEGDRRGGRAEGAAEAGAGQPQIRRPVADRGSQAPGRREIAARQWRTAQPTSRLTG